MATYIQDLNRSDFPLWSDVFQTEAGVSIGYCRKELDVTAPAGTRLTIGTLLLDNGNGTASLPANAAALLAADAKIVIYAGNDVINTDGYGFNPNVSDFTTAHPTQKVVVVWRGRIGVGRTYLTYPAGITTTQKRQVYNILETVNGMEVLRQVPAR